MGNYKPPPNFDRLFLDFRSFTIDNIYVDLQNFIYENIILQISY